MFKRNDESEIRKEVGSEFEHRLRNREPEPGWEGYVAATNEVVEVLMSNTHSVGEPFIYEELENVIKKMKAGIAPDFYGMHSEVIIHAGIGIIKHYSQRKCLRCGETYSLQ